MWMWHMKHCIEYLLSQVSSAVEDNEEEPEYPLPAHLFSPRDEAFYKVSSKVQGLKMCHLAMDQKSN